MAYNRTNLLKRIIEIQNTVLEYQHKGTSQKWVYENIIKVRYFLSEATFYAYLATNAKKELNELNRGKKETN